METTKLGRTDIDVSRLCIGCWQAAGWATSDSERFIRTVRHALDQGLNVLDTAAAYGAGHSEVLVGKAVAGRRDEVVIATKFSSQSSRPEDIRRELNASLKRLNTDYIDLYQQHWPAKDVPLDDTIGELERLKQAGMIRAVGVSNWMPPQWQQLDDPRRIDCLQPCYNLLFRTIEPNVLPLCRKHGIAVIPYSSLCQGMLTGRFKRVEDIPNDPGDPRRRNRRFRHNGFSQALTVVNVLEHIAAKYDKTPAQTALRWLLDQDGVTAPIVGASDPEQVDANLGAFGWRLDPADHRQLAEVSWPLSAALDPTDTLWILPTD